LLLTLDLRVIRFADDSMRFFVGTSGFSYKEWKGEFYPSDLAQSKMLEYYSRRFAAVEINHSFRRMPAASVLQAWADQTPRSFRFVLKAPQAITHFKRLLNAEEATDRFLAVASALKTRQGPLLFQLPPNFKKDVPRLDAFLGRAVQKASVAVEFRHPSWFDDEVYACLRSHSAALCVDDEVGGPMANLVSTARWGYVRLRRERYTTRQLGKWIDQLSAQKWTKAFVFFKHEDTATGPKLATRFLELAGQSDRA
jgi:uncharacterized protein YecE (DUF72 family)